jgi:hypothetical protein
VALAAPVKKRTPEWRGVRAASLRPRQEALVTGSVESLSSKELPCETKLPS